VTGLLLARFVFLFALVAVAGALVALGVREKR
jgi:hypothetical protein